MAVSKKDTGKTANELIKDVNVLKEKRDILQDEKDALEVRVAALEAWQATGLALNNANYVCRDNATYDATNSKTLTITKGLITAIEA